MKSPKAGFVNTPIYKGSTALYKTVDQMEKCLADPLKKTFPAYGRFGSPNVRELEEEITRLESGYASVCTNSGLSAITTSIHAFVSSGDHILVVETAYKPTRNFCDSLSRFGVETEYYSPLLKGTELRKLIRENTRLVYLESPGSNTFEVQDVPSLVHVCVQLDVVTIMDNTWATPLLFNPLKVGVDICIHSATKYISGHSDSILGVVVCNESTYARVRAEAIALGQCGSSDDAYTALRGLKTLPIRLREHENRAIELCRWLQKQPLVQNLIYPGLSDHPQHEIWKRDYRGANGVFSFRFVPSVSRECAIQFLESLSRFALGHSWGGVESLIVPVEFSSTGHLVRVHAGLEPLEDLIADLAAGFRLMDIRKPTTPRKVELDAEILHPT